MKASTPASHEVLMHAVFDHLAGCPRTLRGAELSAQTTRQFCPCRRSVRVGCAGCGEQLILLRDPKRLCRHAAEAPAS